MKSLCFVSLLSAFCLSTNIANSTPLVFDDFQTYQRVSNNSDSPTSDTDTSATYGIGSLSESRTLTVDNVYEFDTSESLTEVSFGEAYMFGDLFNLSTHTLKYEGSTGTDLSNILNLSFSVDTTVNAHLKFEITDMSNVNTDLMWNLMAGNSTIDIDIQSLANLVDLSDTRSLSLIYESNDFFGHNALYRTITYTQKEGNNNVPSPAPLALMLTTAGTYGVGKFILVRMGTAAVAATAGPLVAVGLVGGYVLYQSVDPNVDIEKAFEQIYSSDDASAMP